MNEERLEEQKENASDRQKFDQAVRLWRCDSLAAAVLVVRFGEV